MGSEHVVGQSFKETNISGNARVHMGNVYHVEEAGSEEKRILDWLSPVNPSPSHDQACKQYQPGTIDWFFELSTFQDWYKQGDSPTPPVLWCQGGLGTGKTTLVAQALIHLRNEGVPRSDLAVVYCRYAERELQTAEALLGSILAQLYQNNTNGFDIPSQVKEAYESQPRLWTRKPSLEELQGWLAKRVRAGRPIFILLDALDELDILPVRRLIDKLRSITHGTLRVLATSRDISDIRMELRAFHMTEIEIRAGQKALIALINARFHELGTEEFRTEFLKTPGRLPGHTVAQEVLSHAIKSADGTFLFMSLFLDDIARCTKVQDVLLLLDHPPNLDFLYDQAWRRATTQHAPHKCERARQILMWVSLVQQPLTVRALGEAIMACDPSIAKEPLDEGEIVSSCAGLIRIETTPSQQHGYETIKMVSEEVTNEPQIVSVVTLFHLSAYHYLEKRRQTYFPDADNKIVNACLTRSSSNEVFCALPVCSMLIADLPMLLFYTHLTICGLRTGIYSIFLALVLWHVHWTLRKADYYDLTLWEPKSALTVFSEYTHVFLTRHVITASLSMKLRTVLKISTSPLLYANMLLFWLPSIVLAGYMIVYPIGESHVGVKSQWVFLMLSNYSLVRSRRREGSLEAYQAWVRECMGLFWTVVFEFLWIFGEFLPPMMLWSAWSLATISFILWYVGKSRITTLLAALMH